MKSYLESQITWKAGTSSQILELESRALGIRLFADFAKLILDTESISRNEHACSSDTIYDNSTREVRSVHMHSNGNSSYCGFMVVTLYNVFVVCCRLGGCNR